ncbi:LysR family transcriptional regulator [Stutzerimonas stutzeri DSM 10701]|uniref:LysR family transcriptional regulator n=1 Tax=Stutzerimonas nitrititolerans TaxID=2482751 RepID=UPI00026D74E3|nr:LysR family transcriptional regulator [Stutzerimonas nitrititolerans]AFN77986.1 LysR family transcriptional regulator [Stutzerimonas stutzeri DSM 10701]MBA1184735.1 LysR family transcriptional regulator [Stutzerimonas stutzeri]SUD84574.1 LysR family transcriptional regulator [Stutzerimonas stutzeri]
MLDRITGMRIFVRAVSAGSLSAAGRHLGISPAMATKHVDALEAHLGVKLLHRTTRRLSLTEAGSDYLEACLRILPEIEEAEASAASQRVEARGLLRMNVPLTFGSRYIAPLVPAFSQRHPAVRVELGLNDSQVDLIDGGWDMAVRIGRLADSTLQARRLADCPLVVCAAPAYLDERGVPRKVADLAQHNCLSYTLSQSKDWAFGRDGNARVTVSGDLLANNGSALVAAAVGGQGIIYQPQFIVAGALRRGELVVLELDKPAMDVGGIHLLYPPDRRPPAKVRVMADYLIESFKDEVPWALA